MHGIDTIKRPPGYELFFAPLAVVLEPTVYERVQFAYIASKYGHAKQKRDDGTRYFDHPKAASWIYINELDGRDPRIIIDELLHDVQEDTYLLSSYRISLNFGADNALDVRALTKLPKENETFEENLQRIIARGSETIIAKLCDRLHNVRTLSNCESEKQERKIVETKELLMPLLIPALKSYGGQWAEYADALENKLNEAITALTA